MFLVILVRQTFRTEARPDGGAWSLSLSHRPSLVVNTDLFSQTKQGLSLKVVRHAVWYAETFPLLTGQLESPPPPPTPIGFTNVCVFLPTPMGKLPGFVADKGFLMKIEISDHPQSPQPF